MVAVDRSARRLELVGQACRRLGLANVTTVERDGTTDLGDLEEIAGGSFDRILVDAPCSGLGTLRRNADARWRVTPQDPGALALTQRELLHQASRLLGPGGTLVYSTCTVWPEENEAVVAAVLAEAETEAGGLATDRVRTAEAARATDPFIDDDGFFRSWPHRHGTDGFFAARLTRERPSH